MIENILMCVTNEEIPKDPPRYLFDSTIDTLDEDGHQSWMYNVSVSEYALPDKAPCLIRITLTDGTEILRTRENFNSGRCSCCGDCGSHSIHPVDRVRVYRILNAPKEKK